MLNHATRSTPPTDGTVSLPATIDFHRRHNAQRPVYVFSKEGSSDITEITHLEFGRACDRVARHLNSERKDIGREVVALVALSDTLLYHAVFIGIMRAGMIPYPMSPRNTAAATIKLMKDTSCHRLITTQETLKPLIDEIQALLASGDSQYDLSIEEVPPLHEIYPKLGHETLEDPFEPYPTAPWPALDDVLLYLHSSGSTGFPKTIPQTVISMIHWASFPPMTGMRDHILPIRMGVMVLPPFHTLGIIAQLLVPLYGVIVACLYPPVATTPIAQPVMPTPQNIVDHLRRTDSNALVIIPALLQLWAQNKEIVNLLATFEFVGFSGGSLPSKIGDFMTEAGVNVTPIYGATEFGAPTVILRNEDDIHDWEYIRFSEDIKIRWVPQGDGTYEAQFLASESHRVSIENIPDVRGYSSSDLFVRHPTKTHLWKIVGRRDDVIIHTSGEKTVPAPMEDVIMSSPYIMGVVMFGRERDQAGVLIELKPPYAIDTGNEQELIDARNLIWPIVEEANKVAPAFSRIFKELILIVSRDKPLPRAGKGTIMRKAALAEYNDEIDEIYAKVDATVKGEAVAPPSDWALESVESWLLSQISDIQAGKTFSTTGDLFEQGMDSLSATILRRRITGAMQAPEVQKAAQLVTQTIIYGNPTILKLATFLVGIVVDPENFVTTTSRTEAIEHLIAKYATGLSAELPAKAKETSSRHVADETVVLITGTTGNLGSQVLEALLRDRRVKKVYALNRPSADGKSAKERHADRFTDKGFDVNLLSSDRLVFFEGEMSHRYLGLKIDSYEQLRTQVNVIIHNAWRLDFNLSLLSFEPNVQGTRHLIDLARASPLASSLKFLFTSSVASASSWDKAKGLYPEEVLLDPKYAVGNGYGESKYVSERILALSGLQATSFRIGQISGGLPNGAWATTDWVPIFVKSSIRLGALPSAEGRVSWLPMHAVSKTLLDVAWSEAPSSLALNIVHPRPIAWNAIIDSVNEALVQEGVVHRKISVVSFQTWFGQLEAKAHESSARSINDIPAIKLLEFFRGIVQADLQESHQQSKEGETGGLTVFSTEKVQAVSETMRALSSIGVEDAGLWVKYWKNVGLF